MSLQLSFDKLARQDSRAGASTGSYSLDDVLAGSPRGSEASTSSVGHTRSMASEARDGEISSLLSHLSVAESSKGALASVLQQKMQEISSWRRRHHEIEAERDAVSKLASRLTREGQHLQQQIVEFEATETSLHTQLADVRELADTAAQEKAKAAAELINITRQNNELTTGLAGVNKKNASLASEIYRILDERDETYKSLQAAERKVAELSAQCTELEADHSQFEADFGHLREDIEHCTALQEPLDEDIKRLERGSAEHAAAVERLSSTLEEATQELGDLQATVASASKPEMELCLEANVLQPARPRRPLLRLLRLGVRTGLTVAATLVVAQHADLIRDEIQKFG